MPVSIIIMNINDRSVIKDSFVSLVVPRQGDSIFFNKTGKIYTVVQVVHLFDSMERFSGVSVCVTEAPSLPTSEDLSSVLN